MEAWVAGMSLCVPLTDVVQPLLNRLFRLGVQLTGFFESWGSCLIFHGVSLLVLASQLACIFLWKTLEYEFPSDYGKYWVLAYYGFPHVLLYGSLLILKFKVAGPAGGIGGFFFSPKGEDYFKKGMVYAFIASAVLLVPKGVLEYYRVGQEFSPFSVVEAFFWLYASTVYLFGGALVFATVSTLSDRVAEFEEQIRDRTVGAQALVDAHGMLAARFDVLKDRVSPYLITQVVMSAISCFVLYMEIYVTFVKGDSPRFTEDFFNFSLVQLLTFVPVVAYMAYLNSWAGSLCKVLTVASTCAEYDYHPPTPPPPPVTPQPDVEGGVTGQSGTSEIQQGQPGEPRQAADGGGG